MNEMPWVERPSHTVDLDAPRENHYTDVPDRLVAMGHSLLSAIMSEVPTKLRYLADGVRLRTGNRFHHEFTALAKMVDANWRDLVLANISYDLTLAMIGCSTVALATPRGPVVARNMDWWPEAVLAQSSCLLRFQKNGEFAFANAGWPGSVGVVTGMSRKFSVVLNAAISPDENANTTGYPMLLHLRRVLEDADSFDEALSLLTKTKLVTSGLITLVGTNNDQRVVVERSPTKAALRWPERDAAPLVTTNDYRLLYQPETRDSMEIYQTTCRRYDHLCNHFANHDATKEVSDAQLLYVLTDDHILQGITAQHIVMRPSSREIKMFVPRRLLA